MDLSVFLTLSELVGTIAFAVSGVLVAKKQKLDLFGAVVLGLFTAVGGGVLRDILLGNTPPVMFRKPVYAMTALVTSSIVFYIEKRSRLMEDSAKMVFVLNVADTVGLGVFAVSGTEMVLHSGHRENLFLALFVGVITAVGGGMIRDMLAGRVPIVMRKRIYAVAALLGAALYYLLRDRGKLGIFAAELITVAVVGLIRFAAIHYQLNLPSFDEKD